MATYASRLINCRLRTGAGPVTDTAFVIPKIRELKTCEMITIRPVLEDTYVFYFLKDTYVR